LIHKTKEFFIFLQSIKTFHFFSFSSIYQEEQHLITRYILQHPELISIDYTNEIFFSGYQFPIDYFSSFNSKFLIEKNLIIKENYNINNFHSECITVIHGNGLQGKKIYQM
jgi:hypothetical protein